MHILETPLFASRVKRLHKNQKMELDLAVSSIVEDPYTGKMKKGDLSGLQVYKFKMVNQLTLLLYK